MNRIPCSIGKRHGYKFLRWITDDIIPRGQYPWDYNGHIAQKTYALVEEPSGHIIKVTPEKITIDWNEAERWEDLHG